MDRRQINRVLIITLVLLGIFSSVAFSQDFDLVQIASYYQSGDLGAISTQDDYAFIATQYGFLILDVSDPSDPQEVVHVPTDGICTSVTPFEDFAFACDSQYGLLVFDISNIHNPVLVGSLDPPGSIRKVCPLNNELLYVTAEDYGLDIIDYSDPSNLSLVNYIYVGGTAYDAAVLDNWLYISIGVAGIVIYDISQPEDPEYNFYWNTFGGNARSMYLYPDGQNLLVADFNNGTHILDLTIPNIPTWVQTITDSAHVCITTSGIDQYGYCSYAEAGVVSFDLLGQELDYLQIGWKTGPIGTVGDYVYASRGDSGLTIIDAIPPDNLTVVNQLQDPFRPTVMAILGDVMYLGGMSGGFQVLDIENPNNPVCVNTLESTWLNNLVVSADSNYLYASDFFLGIKVFDITDPWAPQLLTTVATAPDTGSNFLLLRGTYLYDGIWDYGLNIFDLSDPALPVLVYQSPEQIPLYGVFGISDDWQNLYATCYDEEEFKVYSFIGPDSVTLDYEIWDLFECPISIGIKGDFAYVNDNGSKVYVIDISNSAYIFKVDSLQEGTTVGPSSFILDNYMVQSKHDQGFCIYDISDPTDVFKIPGTDTETPGFVGGGIMRTSENFTDSVLYVADYYSLLVYGMYGNGIEGTPRIHPLYDYALLYPAYPNPFNAEAVISFEVFKPGKVKLSVYNINGEKITTLAEQFYQPGNYRVDFSGKSFSSGVYFARLESGGKQQTQKMMLVK